MKLLNSEKKSVIELVRTVIKSSFEKKSEWKILPSLQDKFVKEVGVFVVLKKAGILRGSSGSINPIPLGQGIISSSKAAAFEDQRFNPVEKEEIDELKIEINILDTPKEVSSEKVLNEIKLGHTGIVIKSGAYSSIVLPKRAIENKWDSEQFLENACIKAGLLPDAWKDSTTTIYLFEGFVFSE